MDFSELRLAPHLLQAVTKKGFTEPTPIQEKVIPLLLQGVDVIGQAKTGTGKTAAFGLSLLHLLHANFNHKHGVVALVLTPTRELANQVAEEINELAGGSDRAIAIYGGVDIDRQTRELHRGDRIIVATPGRLLDHLERRTFNLNQLEVLIVDEADRMLDMGFIDDVERIIKACPAKKQMALFSATMPQEVISLSNRFMSQPEYIKASGDEINVAAIRQHYLVLDGHYKVSALANLLKKKNPSRAIVFCRTKHGAERLAGFLHRLGFDAVSLHGNLTQNARDRAMGHFEQGRCQIMVATDLASRGLDVKDVGMIVNYDLPEDDKVYLHRIGRTGRAGSGGEAYSMATNLQEERFLKSVSQRINAPILEEKADTTRADFVRGEKQREQQRSFHGRQGGRRDGRRGDRPRSHFGNRSTGRPRRGQPLPHQTHHSSSTSHSGKSLIGGREVFG